MSIFLKKSISIMAITLCSVAPLLAVSGVPVGDFPKILEQQLLSILGGEKIIENKLRKEQSAKLKSLTEQQNEQIDALIMRLNGTAHITNGNSLDISSLENMDGASVSDTYGQDALIQNEIITPNATYMARLFGDAPMSIEEMIVETARKYENNPGVSATRLNALQWRCYFQALVWQESRFNSAAESPVGAFGLTQIMPGTFDYLHIPRGQRTNPMVQLDGGARYILEQMRQFKRVDASLAAYNAGPGAVQKYGGVPPYKETQNYVKLITARANYYMANITSTAQLGTITPAEFAIAEYANYAVAGYELSVNSNAQIIMAFQRIKNLIAEIDTTNSVKDAMNINSYLRAEVTRITNMINFQKAAQQKIEAQKWAAYLAVYQSDEKFMTLINSSEKKSN